MLTEANMLQVMQQVRLDPEKFCYWLQGFCEVHGAAPTEEQWKIVKEHLELVFAKAYIPQQTITTTAQEVPLWQQLQGPPNGSAVTIC